MPWKAASPYTEICPGRSTVLYLGYYQDETDAGGRAGHYVSLIPRVSRSPLPNPNTFNVLNSESKILKALFLDPTIVSLSIDRLKNVDLDSPSITNSDIMETLSTVKNHYSSDTITGISVRQFITKCNNELTTANRENNCIDVTVYESSMPVDTVSSCTLELGVFDSVFEENATDTFAAHPSIHTSSSSIIYPSITTTPSIRKRVSVRVSTTSPEDICDLNRKKRKICSVELTPPPMSPPKRRRGRPKKNFLSSPPATSPPKKKRGRPRKEA